MGPTKALIRFTDRRTGRASTFGLYQNACRAELDVVQNGTVGEANKYDIELFFVDDFGESVRVEIDIDENTSFTGEASYRSANITNGKRLFVYSIVPPDAKARLFNCCFGFVRLEVNVSSTGSQRSLLRGFTKDIPCLTDAYDDRESIITKMIGGLSSAASSPVSKWLFTGKEGDGSVFCLMEGGMVSDESTSVEAFTALVARILSTYERYLPFFSSRAFSRVIKHDELTNARSVKKAGKRELMWLARNVQQLERVGYETGISINDEHFMPKKIKTEKTTRTFDNPENRAVISFLRKVIKSLDEWEERFASAPQGPRVDPELMESMRSYGEHFPPYIVLKQNAQRVLKRETDFESLRIKATRLLRSYTRVMPDVLDEPFVMLPRNSKVFMEIKPYFDIYKLMEEWVQFGSLPMFREGLSMSTFRLDKLFEYYCLAKLLMWLNRYGFVPDEEMRHPIESPRYTTTECHFTNEEQVATVYHLVNSKARVTLYYQPVIYGSSKEEGGIKLHKTVSSIKGAQDPDADIWTPDYLLVYSKLDGSDERKVVLDAKFRLREVLFRSDSGGSSTFEECFSKYREKTAEALPGRGVDAVWLLSGLDSVKYCYRREDSAWARSARGFVPSGAVSVGPLSSNLNAMFKELGFGELIELPDADAGQKTAAPAAAVARSVPPASTAIASTVQAPQLGQAGVREAQTAEPDQPTQKMRVVKVADIRAEEPVSAGTEPVRERPQQAAVKPDSEFAAVPLPEDEQAAVDESQPSKREKSAWLLRFEQERAEAEAERKRQEEIELRRKAEKAERERLKEEQRRQRELEKEAEAKARALANAAEREEAGENGRRQRELDEEALSLLDELFAAIDDLGRLFDGEECFKLLNLEHPVLSFEVADEDRYLYDPSTREFDGKEAYLFANWKKKSLTRLKKVVKDFKKERKKEAERVAPEPQAPVVPAGSAKPKPVEIAVGIYELEANKDKLFTNQFAKRVGANMPVFLKKTAKSQRKNYEAFDADGEELFVLTRWTRVGEQLLSNYWESLQR